MDKEPIRNIFLVLSGGWTLITFIYLSSNLTFSTVLEIIVLPVGVFWLIYVGIVNILPTLGKKEPAAIPQKPMVKQSPMDIYNQEMAIKSREEIPHEVALRMKENEKKTSDVQLAALLEKKKPRGG